MPREVDRGVAELLTWARKEILDVKLETAPADPAVGAGPVYRLATVVMALTDLTERLLQREHEHTGGAPLDLQRFGGT